MDELICETTTSKQENMLFNALLIQMNFMYINRPSVIGIDQTTEKIQNGEQITVSCDEFSIGSNDLTQLTLGVDRDSEKVVFDFD